MTPLQALEHIIKNVQANTNIEQPVCKITGITQFGFYILDNQDFVSFPESGLELVEPEKEETNDYLDAMEYFMKNDKPIYHEGAKDTRIILAFSKDDEYVQIRGHGLYKRVDVKIIGKEVKIPKLPKIPKLTKKATK